MGQVWSSRVVDVMERICRAVAAAAVKTPRAVLVQMLLALTGVAVSWRSIVGSFVTVAPLLIATAKFGPTGPACWPGRPLAGDEEVPRLHLVPARQLVKCAAAGASYHGRRAEMITRIVAASNVRPGHVVTMPSAGPHLTLRLMTDVDLLLAAAIASVRMNRPTSVFEPPASLAACARCQEAWKGGAQSSCMGTKVSSTREQL